MNAARQSSLFNSPPQSHMARPAPTPAVDPRVHVCRSCHRVNAPCGIGEAWLCLACVPPDFFPRNRGGR